MSYTTHNTRHTPQVIVLVVLSAHGDDLLHLFLREIVRELACYIDWDGCKRLHFLRNSKFLVYFHAECRRLRDNLMKSWDKDRPEMSEQQETKENVAYESHLLLFLHE